MPDLVADHAPDIQWIIALWLAIHGGDPAPQRIHVLKGGVTVLSQLDVDDSAGTDRIRADVLGAMRKALDSYEK